MNKIVNKFLLARDKFMTELHLRQPGFTYCACGPCTMHRERINKFRETGTLDHIYQKKLSKTCFANDAAYSDSKDLAKRTISDKILKDRTNQISVNPKHHEYQKELANMVCKFFDKEIRSGTSVNEELAQELHRLVIKKIKRRNVCARFNDSQHI